MAVAALDEVLPNAIVRCDCNQPDKPQNTILVRGKVTAVEKGVGAYWTEEEDDERSSVEHRVPFGDPKSQANSLHLVITTTDVIPADGVPETLRVGIPSYPGDDLTKTAAGWTSLGELVLILDPESPFDDYDESLYGIRSNGLLAATIGQDGNLSLPFADQDETATLLARTPTWAALKASANDRRLIVPVREDGGAIVRADRPAWRE